MSEQPTIGVLAYQGDVREHRRILDGLGVPSLEVRTLADLDRLDGLIVPGGESTVIGKLTERYGLLEPLRSRARAGFPILGTCAGMIFMAREVEGPPQQLLGVLDMRVRRNAFGPQVASFEAEVDVKGIDGGPVSAAFIRAPWASETGPDVEVIAEIDGRVIGARQGNLLAVAFHPELTGDTRLHRWFVDLARAAVERGVHGQPPDPA
ncbi:MAG TPA: pyridoxal 5'-phosphate synthase glutaminase subunit PdxT [Actinomycetota bacterium]|jgi:5'-phosphate synthase pdxT subunit|nr:pyridoxal 5'-phosphate synthase glutaminase subunit PdxT [Actinomycetota bacterium]